MAAAPECVKVVAARTYVENRHELATVCLGTVSYSKREVGFEHVRLISAKRPGRQVAGTVAGSLCARVDRGALVTYRLSCK